jgi:predicted DNA-binding transcriptional regulator YafY
MLKERQLTLTYNNKPDVIVHPLGVVLREQTIYLIGAFYNYKDIRQLAVLVNSPIDKPTRFSLEEYCDSGAMGYLASEGDLALELKMTKPAARHLYETAISSDQKIVDHDDKHVLVTGTVKDSKDLRWWILGFGNQVEVIAPEYLRDEISAHALGMVKAYGGTQ